MWSRGFTTSLPGADLAHVTVESLLEPRMLGFDQDPSVVLVAEIENLQVDAVGHA
jgi:hypothetical protein